MNNKTATASIKHYVKGLKTSFTQDQLLECFDVHYTTMRDILTSMVESNGIMLLTTRKDINKKNKTFIVAKHFKEQENFLYRPALQYRPDVNYRASRCG